MSTTVKTGWLKDKNGDKFAPKTLISQVQTSDGILLEDKLQLENLFAGGMAVLSNYQYGSELPEAGTVGRLFFKVVG